MSSVVLHQERLQHSVRHEQSHCVLNLCHLCIGRHRSLAARCSSHPRQPRTHHQAALCTQQSELFCTCTCSISMHGPWVYVNQLVPELCRPKSASSSTFTCVVGSLAGGYQLVAICQHEGVHGKCNRIMFIPERTHCQAGSSSVQSCLQGKQQKLPSYCCDGSLPELRASCTYNCKQRLRGGHGARRVSPASQPHRLFLSPSAHSSAEHSERSSAGVLLHLNTELSTLLQWRCTAAGNQCLGALLLSLRALLRFVTSSFAQVQATPG